MNQGTQFYPLLAVQAAGLELQDYSLIGDALCPPFVQDSLKGTFEKFREVDMYTIPDVSRGNYAPAKASTEQFDYDSYDCSGRAQKSTWTFAELNDKMRARSQDDIFREATLLRTKDLRLAHEKEVETLFTTDANYLADNVVDVISTYDAFDDYTLTLNPIEVIQKAGKKCAGGMYNTIAMGADVAMAIRFNPVVRGMFGSPGNRGVGTQMITDEILHFLLFNGRTAGTRLLIGEGVYNTGSDKDTVTKGQFWSNSVFVGNISTLPGVEGLRSFARNMVYDAPLGGNSQARVSTTQYYRVRTFPEDSIGGGAISLEVDRFVDPKVTFKPYGVRLKNLLDAPGL